MIFLNIPIETYLPIAIAIGLLIMIITSIVIYRKYKVKPISLIEVDLLISCFNEDNIKDVTFIRNKINITTINPKKVNYDKLKEEGVLGINIVGDTVKFYFEENNDLVFESLKSELKNRGIL